MKGRSCAEARLGIGFLEGIALRDSVSLVLCGWKLLAKSKQAEGKAVLAPATETQERDADDRRCKLGINYFKNKNNKNKIT